MTLSLAAVIVAFVVLFTVRFFVIPEMEKNELDTDRPSL